ncbi:MAG: beta-ketoacyl-ACP synthase I [Alphaproteobacteria bacterium]
MRRVVVTGLGIVSAIGNDAKAVTESLKSGTSGISHSPDYAERGFRSHVCGDIKGLDLDAMIDKRLRRFMGDGAAYNYIAMKQAIEDAGLDDDLVSNERSGLVVGSGGPSTRNLCHAFDTARNQSAKRVGPFMVPRVMSSTNSATLATPFKIKGVNYTISSACTTSLHCIGHGTELIQWGKQDIVFAGGGEELDWTMTVLFDAMGALSSNFNDDPTRASRAYDQGRDGFVIAGGGGVVVLEALDHALARGAKIYGEVVGYAANSDGHDMVQPSGEGAVRCMKLAMKGHDGQGLDGKINYINTHGTSTPVGDLKELEAIKQVFDQDNMPMIGSTKSMTGHSLGATGAQELIYCLLMMQHGFIAPSINIDTLDPAAENMPIALQRVDNVDFDMVLSNSFGFGGTNGSIIMRKMK